MKMAVSLGLAQCCTGMGNTNTQDGCWVGVSLLTGYSRHGSKSQIASYSVIKLMRSGFFRCSLAWIIRVKKFYIFKLFRYASIQNKVCKSAFNVSHMD